MEELIEIAEREDGSLGVCKSLSRKRLINSYAYEREVIL